MANSVKKHLLFLTTANLPTNPRLLKEIDLAIKAYRVTVVLWRLGNWSDAINEQMMQDRPGVNFVLLDATRVNKLRWGLWGLVEKVSRFAYPVFKNMLFVNALAHTRRSIQIYRALKHIPHPHLIVAHNLGALYPAYLMASKNKLPFIYDIEDYDPGIHVPQGGKHYVACTQFLLRHCAPKAAVLTSASPLIWKYTAPLLSPRRGEDGEQNLPTHQVILNSFPQNEFIAPTLLSAEALAKEENSKLETQMEQCELEQRGNRRSQIPPPKFELGGNAKLKLVWFSQKISFGRGLEQLFDALSQLKTQMEQRNIPSPKFELGGNSKLSITLIGDMDPAFHEQVIKPLSAVAFLEHQSYPAEALAKEGQSFSSAEASPLSQSYSGQRAKEGHLSAVAAAKENQSLIANRQLPIAISILPPLSQPELHAELAKHDVGLALEPGKDLNNELAISNKIIAYAQAGLYILATDTPAQQQFMQEHPGFGSVCGQDKEGMCKGLTEIMKVMDEINTNKLTRFKKGKDLAWEKESGKLVEIWKQINRKIDQ